MVYLYQKLRTKIPQMEEKKTSEEERNACVVCYLPCTPPNVGCSRHSNRNPVCMPCLQQWVSIARTGRACLKRASWSNCICWLSVSVSFDITPFISTGKQAACPWCHRDFTREELNKILFSNSCVPADSSLEKPILVRQSKEVTFKICRVWLLLLLGANLYSVRTRIGEPIEPFTYSMRCQSMRQKWEGNMKRDVCMADCTRMRPLEAVIDIYHASLLFAHRSLSQNIFC